MGRLYVANFPWETTEEELTGLFAKHGEVKEAKIIIHRESGRSRGFGFIEMENSDKVIESLDNTDFNGRILKVSVARERPNREVQRET